MGAWDTGPFDNDDAADFADDLDDAAAEPERQMALIRAALETAADRQDYLHADEGAAAVAAAAVLAAGLPGAEPYRSAVYGPRDAFPQAPPEFPALAVRALDRVLGADSELAGLWGGAADHGERTWQAVTSELRGMLAEAADRLEAASGRPSLPTMPTLRT